MHCGLFLTHLSCLFVLVLISAESVAAENQIPPEAMDVWENKQKQWEKDVWELREKFAGARNSQVVQLIAADSGRWLLDEQPHLDSVDKEDKATLSETRLLLTKSAELVAVSAQDGTQWTVRAYSVRRDVKSGEGYVETDVEGKLVESKSIAFAPYAYLSIPLAELFEKENIKEVSVNRVSENEVQINFLFDPPPGHMELKDGVGRVQLKGEPPLPKTRVVITVDPSAEWRVTQVVNNFLDEEGNPAASGEQSIVYEGEKAFTVINSMNARGKKSKMSETHVSVSKVAFEESDFVPATYGVKGEEKAGTSQAVIVAMCISGAVAVMVGFWLLRRK